MFIVKFVRKDNDKVEDMQNIQNIQITDTQKELLCLRSSVIENFIEGDIILIPEYVSRESFIHILHFIDTCPSDFDHIFAKPIDKNDFHTKAWMFENWCEGMEKKVLFNLLNSANYLIMKSLIDLLCAYIALRIKYMTNEDMVDYFTN